MFASQVLFWQHLIKCLHPIQVFCDFDLTVLQHVVLFCAQVKPVSQRTNTRYCEMLALCIILIPIAHMLFNNPLQYTTWQIFKNTNNHKTQFPSSLKHNKNIYLPAIVFISQLPWMAMFCLFRVCNWTLSFSDRVYPLIYSNMITAKSKPTE